MTGRGSLVVAIGSWTGLAPWAVALLLGTLLVGTLFLIGSCRR